MHILWHGQCRASRGTREPPGLVEGLQVEFDIGGEIKTEGIACDEEVRRRINTSTLTQQMTQLEQGKTKGCPAMPRVTFWPEQLGEGFAQMDAAFYCQIDEQREFLACGEQQQLISMMDFWVPQQCEA